MSRQPPPTTKMCRVRTFFRPKNNETFLGHFFVAQICWLNDNKFGHQQNCAKGPPALDDFFLQSSNGALFCYYTFLLSRELIQIVPSAFNMYSFTLI